MRPVTLILALFIISAADLSSTWYLIGNVPGNEINPFVSTGDFTEFLFSPIPIIIALWFIGCVIYAEKNSKKFNCYLKSLSLPLAIFLFPIYFLGLRFLIVINNLFAIAGKKTPVSFFMSPFRYFSEDEFIQLWLLNTAALVLSAPLIIYIGKVLYREKKEHEGNNYSPAPDARDDQHRNVDQPADKAS